MCKPCVDESFQIDNCIVYDKSLNWISDKTVAYFWSHCSVSIIINDFLLECETVVVVFVVVRMLTKHNFSGATKPRSNTI